MSKQLKITSIDEIRARSDAQPVELPGYGDGNPVCFKLRRVSLLEMMRAGKIPNELKSAVADLYSRGRVTGTDLKATADTMLLIAEKAMAEPTLDEIRQAGLTLTDEQITAIYLYTRSGLEGLRPFRPEPGISRPVQDGANVEDAAKRAAGIA